MYVRTVGKKELNFQVSGMLWERSLVMRDPETKTLWSHLLGRGMRGKLKGVELERVPSIITTWEDWKARHPMSSVLAMKRTVERFNDNQWDEKSRKLVFGLLGMEEGHSTAVSITRLQKDGVVSTKAGQATVVFTHLSDSGSVQAFRAELNGKPLSLAIDKEKTMKDRETGSTWDRTSGEAIAGPGKGQFLPVLPGTLSYQKAWETFYPSSKIIR